MRNTGVLKRRGRGILEQAADIYVNLSCHFFRKRDKGGSGKFSFQILGEVFLCVDGYQFVCRGIEVVDDCLNRNLVLLAGIEA